MRSIALGFVCLAAIGCGEDQTVSGVFPSSGFLGRTMRVQVSGDNTEWGNGVQLDFGPGITVSSVSVASPTSLFADIVISDTAAAGVRDVVVRGSGDTLTLNDAFELASPINVTWQGTLAQGSVVNFTITNFDFFAPFDTTCTLDAGFFGCLEYGYTTVESPPGTIAVLSGVSPYTLTGTMYIDMDAAPGPFRVLSGPTTPLISPLGGDQDITARTATALTGGMATTTVAAAYESHVYDVTTMANNVNRFSASTQEGAPRIYLLPESGTFNELIGQGSRPVSISQTAGRVYAVVADGSGESGFSYTFRHQPLSVTPVAEGANNDTSGTAQTVAAAALVTGGAITSVDDEDWYSFSVPANSANRSVRVVTAGGDPLADVAVEIFANSDANSIGGDDAGYHENVTSDDPVGNATTILVRIYTDPQYYNPAHTQYIAAIWLE